MTPTTTSSAPRLASDRDPPTAWIDRLFARFHALYGKHWLDMWHDISVDAVKESWRIALAGCSAEQLRYALAHCMATSKFPPTAPEFAGVCRQFRPSPTAAGYLLPAPRELAGSAIAAGLASTLRSQPDQRDGDCRGWARKILAEAEDGVIYPMISIDNAREALGIKR